MTGKSDKHAGLPVPCNSKLFKDSSDYSAGFPSGPTMWENEIHHIVCEHSILDITVKPASKLKYVRDCLCATTWDINKKPNLIQLPLKQTYMASDGQTPSNLCAHNCDHNITDGYTSEVKKWLHEQVWDTISEKQKVHQTDVTKIEDQLDKCMRRYAKQLTKRGIRCMGTKIAWENRFGDGWQTSWYQPFSMADDPFVTPRLPVRRWPKCLSLLSGW
jgi:hypothetical protein